MGVNRLENILMPIKTETPEEEVYWMPLHHMKQPNRRQQSNKQLRYLIRSTKSLQETGMPLEIGSVLRTKIPTMPFTRPLQSLALLQRRVMANVLGKF